MTLKLRVALQGGGAKLVTLMAAADALSDLQNEGKIEITQLAGTSAGAIVACMLASKDPMESYRLQTLKAANEVITHFEIKSWKSTIFWKLIQGTPIFPETKVRKFMHELFGDDRLSSVKIRTKLIASSVRNREKHVYDSSKDEYKIADVVTNSCALPLAFRSYLQSDLTVDGGLVSNFPAAELINENPEQDSLLGFSFEYEQEDDPADLLGYLGALASTAIESNVQYNAQRIQEVGGRVCKLPNHFSTFDFKRALGALETKPYNEAKLLARAKIEETLALLAQQSKAVNRAAGESIDTKLFRIYAALMKEFPVKAVRASTFITAHCLDVKVDSSTAKADEIIQTVDYRSQYPGEKIIAVRLGLATGGAIPMSNEKDDIRVTDSQGNQLDATSMIIEKNGYYSSMLVLDQPITLAAQQYLRVVHRTTQQGLMNDLIQYQRTAIRSVSRQDNTMEIDDIIIAVPVSRGPVVLTDLYDQIPLLQNEGLPYNQQAVMGHWKEGRLMTEEELRKAYYGLWPNGFDVLGWRTENLESGHYCGVLVQIAT